MMYAGVIGLNVHFDGSMNLTICKEMFLSNHANNLFIICISRKLSSHGTHLLHAKGDADTLIAKTALGIDATHSIKKAPKDPLKVI